MMSEVDGGGSVPELMDGDPQSSRLLNAAGDLDSE
jgi:hypothetical protein